MVKEVHSDEEFRKILDTSGSRLVVVDYTAVWCKPCQMIAPYVQQLSDENAADVVFLKVDVDKCTETASKQGVQSMPTFEFFRNGATLTRFSGASRSMLDSYVTKLKDPRVTSVDAAELPKSPTPLQHLALLALHFVCALMFGFTARHVYLSIYPQGQMSMIVMFVGVAIGTKIVELLRSVFSF